MYDQLIKASAHGEVDYNAFIILGRLSSFIWFTTSDRIYAQLGYEISTLIFYIVLSSPIFQSLSASEWVRQHIGNTCPELHFVQYIKV